MSPLWVPTLPILVVLSLFIHVYSEFVLDSENSTTNWPSILPATSPPTIDNTESPTTSTLVSRSPTTSPTKLIRRKSDDSLTHTCGAKDPQTGAVRPMRIMTSITDEYLPVLLNWMVYYHRICPTVENMYIICLDGAVEKKLAHYGLTCAHVFHAKGSHNDIWLARTRLTHSLLKDGVDVLLSDADALWLRNPFPLLERYLSSDVIASRGSFPENVSKSLGACICMGFIYIKASEHTATLWGEIAAHMARQANPDDQRDINSLLHSLGLHYATRPTYIGSTEYSTGHFQHHNHNYAVTLLPHVSFRRICDQERKGDTFSAVVAHCLTHEKKGSSKVSTAESMGLWQLRRGWEEVTLRGNLQAYLDEISSDSGGDEGSTKRALGVRNSTSTTVGTPSFASSRNSDRNSNSDSSRAGAHPVGAIPTSVGTVAESAVGCAEYSQNRAVFHSPGGVAARSCWYVSISAPEEVIRHFEELVSSGAVWTD